MGPDGVEPPLRPHAGCGLRAAVQDNTNVFLSNIQSLTSLVEKHMSQLDTQVRSTAEPAPLCLQQAPSCSHWSARPDTRRYSG